MMERMKVKMRMEMMMVIEMMMMIAVVMMVMVTKMMMKMKKIKTAIPMMKMLIQLTFLFLVHRFEAVISCMA